jgi:hypothetical protein
LRIRSDGEAELPSHFFSGLLLYELFDRNRYLGSSVAIGGKRTPGGHPVSVAIAQIAARAAEYGKDDAVALANDTSGGFRRLIQIVFGLSIAFAASSFFLSFFSFGGGVLV